MVNEIGYEGEGRGSQPSRTSASSSLTSLQMQKCTPPLWSSSCARIWHTRTERTAQLLVGYRTPSEVATDQCPITPDQPPVSKLPHGLTMSGLW